MNEPDPDEMTTTVDVLRYGGDEPRYMAVPGDDGTKVVGANAREAARRRRRRLFVFLVVAAALGAVGTYFHSVLAGSAGAALVLILSAAAERTRDDGVPEVVGRNVHAEEAVEVYEVDGYVAEVFVDPDAGSDEGVGR